jgi:hypothetical protein
MENKESLKEYMIKEIEIIQDTIKRMAFNSFMIKRWAITLVLWSQRRISARRYLPSHRDITSSGV